MTWTSAAARRLRAFAGKASTIEEAVREIACRFLDDIECPPTDLDALCSRLNVTKFVEEDLPISGGLRRDGTGFKIVYSSQLSRHRKRFTIAHEMGHAIFEMTGPNPPRAGRELEQLCDMLAAELLLPRHVFVRLCDRRPKLDSVVELSRLFDVSLVAAARRCCEFTSMSAFEVDGDVVTWSCGLAPTHRLQLGMATRDALRTLVRDEKARLHGRDAASGNTELVSLLTHAFEGRRVRDTVLLYENGGWGREWEFEGMPIGNGKRAFFTLRHYRRSDEPTSS